MVDISLIKLADFGTIKNSEKLFPYTSYISTRWYRAPECCFRAKDYDYTVDIFALGCIMAELYMLQPIFMGHTELDQLNKICGVLGTPSKEEWLEGYEYAQQKGI
jgi:serine/threonine protein kinase